MNQKNDIFDSFITRPKFITNKMKMKTENTIFIKMVFSVYDRPIG